MKEVATDLKAIYSASTEGEAELNLELFAEKWDRLYPSISATWRTHWVRVIPWFAFPQDIRKVIYTTNATLVDEYDAAPGHAQSPHLSF